MTHTKNEEINHSPLWIALRLLGPSSIFVLVLALVILWITMLPSEISIGSYTGQMLGTVTVLLMSIGLALVSTHPLVEPWFGGIDRAAIWHRSVMIVGVLLLLPHAELASNPNGSELGNAFANLGTAGLVFLVAWAILPRWRMLTPPLFHAFIKDVGNVQAVNQIAAVVKTFWRLRAMAIFSQNNRYISGYRIFAWLT